VSRVGLGRHGQLESGAGDPLDGLVNLFDVGMVLAVGFLIAGLSLGAKREELKQQQKTRAEATQTTITKPSSRQRASGAGQAVGQVYRLGDGRLVLVRPKR
jgi:hypothetical protein